MLKLSFKFIKKNNRSDRQSLDLNTYSSLNFFKTIIFDKKKKVICLLLNFIKINSRWLWIGITKKPSSNRTCTTLISEAALHPKMYVILISPFTKPLPVMPWFRMMKSSALIGIIQRRDPRRPHKLALWPSVLIVDKKSSHSGITWKWSSWCAKTKK